MKKEGLMKQLYIFTILSVNGEALDSQKMIGNGLVAIENWHSDN